MSNEESVFVKKWLTAACLVIVGGCVGLGLTEVLVRVSYPYTRDSVIPGRLFMIDDELGWKFAPSKTARHQTRYFDTTYTINTLGFRDRPRTETKIGRRIVLYGDSLVFGWGVEESERFSDLLEDKLKGLEILNHAIPGWGLDQEILLYEKEGAALRADEAMFFVGRSTLRRIHSAFIYSKYKPMFTLRQDGELTLKAVPTGRNTAVRFFYEMLSPFYLPYFLQNAIATVQTRFKQTGNASPESLDSQHLVDDLSRELLRRARNTARTRNQHMTILAANLSEFDRNELRRFSAEGGIDYVEIAANILATVSTDDNSDLIFGPYDRHWNANANRLISEHLLPQLSK